MNQNYKISVIIPCYNVEKYVKKCLDTVLMQSVGLEHLEIILIDDSSSDNTVNILKEYEKQYPNNIMVILCDKNGKQGTARNIGLTYATGEYISFVDADDWIHKDMYKLLMDIIIKTDCDIVQFKHKEIREENIEDNEIDNIDYKIYEYAQNRKRYIVNSKILDESCSNKIYKKAVLDKAGVKYAEGVVYEEPLFTYPLKFYVDRVCVTDKSFYYYRQNLNGTMLNYMNNPATMTQHLKVQLEVYLRMKSSGFFEEYKEEINLYFIHTFYAEIFYFMAVRGMIMPEVLFRYIVKTLKMYVPEYMSNIYINMPELANDKKALELIQYENCDDEKLQKKILEYMMTLR